MTHEFTGQVPPSINGQEIEDSYGVISSDPLDHRIAGVALEYHLRQFDPQEVGAQINYLLANRGDLSAECGPARVNRLIARKRDFLNSQTIAVTTIHLSPEPEHRDPKDPSIIRR